MPKRELLTDAAGEARELTAADMKRFRPAREVLPPEMLEKLGVRGPGHGLVHQSAHGKDQGDCREKKEESL